MTESGSEESAYHSIVDRESVQSSSTGSGFGGSDFSDLSFDCLTNNSAVLTSIWEFLDPAGRRRLITTSLEVWEDVQDFVCLV